MIIAIIIGRTASSCMRNDRSTTYVSAKVNVISLLYVRRRVKLADANDPINESRGKPRRARRFFAHCARQKKEQRESIKWIGKV